MESTCGGRGERGSKAAGLADEPCGQEGVTGCLAPSPETASRATALAGLGPEAAGGDGCPKPPPQPCRGPAHDSGALGAQGEGQDPGTSPPPHPLQYTHPNFPLGSFSLTCLCLSPLPSHPVCCLPASPLPTGPPPTHSWSLSLLDLNLVLLQAELDSQRDSISLARSTGQRLLADGHPSTPDILQALAGLDQELNTLERAWQGHQHRLQQALELQVGSLHPAPTPGLGATPIAPGQSQTQKGGHTGAFSHHLALTTHLAQAALAWRGLILLNQVLGPWSVSSGHTQVPLQWLDPLLTSFCLFLS